MAELPAAFERAISSRFRLVSNLGRGGWGDVYLAQDLEHDRQVAIKVLREELSVGLARDRFLREIAFATQLVHPNVVPLYESGEADGRLFYVMRFVDGETLAHRIARERQLAVPAAAQIALQIAGALAFAHSHGVVHRDVKPGNVLLCGDQALLSDFGIARAITRSADGDSLTLSGVQLGTPAYMSPEAASPEEPIDGRSDIYSLGCVLYEMLAGTPPFSGPTATAILARHAVDTVPPLRTVRRSMPAHLDAAVMRALEKVPADRFATAADFARAIEAGEAGGRVSVASWWKNAQRRPARLTVAVLGSSILGLGAWGLLQWIAGPAVADSAEPSSVARVDTSRYLVLPLEHTAALSNAESLQQLLHDAIARWNGLSLVDGFQARDALARRPSNNLTAPEARELARDLGAGRYVRSEASLSRDSVRLSATLYDATAGVLLRSAMRRIAASEVHADSVMKDLADELLFRDKPGRDLGASDVGTRSLPARQAYRRGLASIEQWSLADAESHFFAASTYDPEYAQAYVWLAQVRFWTRQPIANWVSASKGAVRTSARLSARDRMLAQALAAFASGDAPKACAMWNGLTQREPNDFVAWYGSGMCQILDDAVVPASSTPSGWRFRTSYGHALTHMRRAFELLPSIHLALRGDAYAPIRRLLKTAVNDTRGGRALPPDQTTFVASPSWEGDTLVFHPFRTDDLAAARSDVIRRLPASVDEAVRHQRETFRDLAITWSTAYPRSAVALHALAVSLEMLGNTAALDTLRRAMTLAQTKHDSLEFAATELWTRLKFAVPHNESAVRAVRKLADSLLAAHDPTDSVAAQQLVGIATLTGRATLAARLARYRSARRFWGVPSTLGASAPAFLVYAALGGPRDSVQALHALLSATIDRNFVGPDREGPRSTWLARGASLVFPDPVLSPIGSRADTSDYLLTAQAASLARDTALVKHGIAMIQLARTRMRTRSLTPDAVLPEAILLRLAGDSPAAVAWLDGALESIVGSMPRLMPDPIHAGTTIRALALRAELAAQAGDRATARKWSAPVIALWKDADAFLQPTVKRMRELHK